MPSRLFLDISLIRANADFRRILIARTISLMGLGMLAVSVPLQIYDLTGSSFQVGLAAALDGAGMFAGLLLGGVIADLHDRRRLILFARSVCGLGFVALALNSMLPSPSVAAIYALAAWDGFFGALGVSALMAAMPHIVGRENLMQASALGMMTARFTTIVSPALGGVVIALAGLTWNYAIAATGTLLTVLTLVSLPAMVPPRGEPEHPLRMLAQSFDFVFRRLALLVLFALGAIMTLTSGVRILFPALAGGPFGGGAFETGLLFSAVPIGATAGAVTSGWARNVTQPDTVMVLLCLLAFASIAAFGFAGNLYLGMALLVVYGYATAIASILQYTLVQAHTPDAFLGRVNSLWAAMDNLGDIAGALVMGFAAQIFMPGESVLALGLAALAIGLALGASSVAYAGPIAKHLWNRRSPEGPDLVAAEQNMDIREIDMMHAEPAIKGAALSKEALRRQVRRFLDEEPEDDDNLMDFGLTSIDVMKLVTEWKDADIEVDFIALARRPTINGFWHLLQQKLPANAGLAARSA